MSAVVWALSSLLTIGFGSAVMLIPRVRSFDLPGRLAASFVAGTLGAGVLLYAESLAGIRWSALSVAGPLLLCAAAFGRLLFAPGTDRGRFPWALLGVTALCSYGAFTARITCGDLLFFWGPKSQRFFQQRHIDFAFLADPQHYLMHSDYPPLQTLANVFSSIVTGAFSFEGAVLTTPIYLLAGILVFRSLARPSIGTRNANAFAALLAAVLTLGIGGGRAAGGADPMLLMFEIVALAAATFTDESTGEWIAGFALAAAAFTKVEGLTFALALAGLLLVRHRRARVLITTLLPGMILVGSWIAVSRAHGLIDSYQRTGAPLQPGNLALVVTVVAATASYGAAHLPWLAALAPLALGREWRRAALPFLAGVASIAFAVFFYLHEPDPVFWIQSSAERVLLTALACFVVASAASSEYSPESDGLVP